MSRGQIDRPGARRRVGLAGVVSVAVWLLAGSAVAQPAEPQAPAPAAPGEEGEPAVLAPQAVPSTPAGDSAAAGTRAPKRGAGRWGVAAGGPDAPSGVAAGAPRAVGPHGVIPREHGLGHRPAPAPEQQPGQSRVEVHADLLNLFLYRNDSDFDRSEPTYNENGQTVGAFATVFRPMVTFHVDPHLRLFYEAELGLNFWSKNNPDQEAALSPDVFVLKHRQVYAQGEMLEGDLGFKVGYQYFSDPTELFLGHWIGAASAHYALGQDDRVGLFVGQVSDQTYEGINVENNNFRRDIFVFGPRIDLALGPDMSLSSAVVGLYDAHLVDRTRWLVAPAVRFAVESGGASVTLDGVLQMGKEQQAALGNGDQKIFAWAVQAHGTLETHPAVLDVNALVLSSDDAKDGNENAGTFLYSSRSRSATLMLTEDELRNWYDQVDRRAAAYRGGFWEHRAGLAVADIKGTWIVSRVFRPALVLGGAAVLQKNNALDNRFVGVETDLDLEFRASEKLSAHLVGGALLPGKAASALINGIDRSATDPVYMIEASLLASY